MMKKTTRILPLVFSVLLLAPVLAVLSPTARAQCTNWDASGELAINQRGQNAFIYLKLQQKGRVLTGTAKQYFRYTGTVDGTIDGDTFSVQIFWIDNLTGVYNGKVLPSGRLDGETYDKNNTNIRQPWHSTGVLKCSPVPVKSSAALIKSGGIKPKPPSSGNSHVILPKPDPVNSSIGEAPKSTPAPAMKVPGIVASQATFRAPGYPTGTVILTWDGGPDHPYAEVWVKVNNGDDTFVVEQGKGSREVTVERGRSYAFILTDAGTTLATVGFIVP